MEDLEELEATLGTVIPMTPMTSVNATPGPSVSSDVSHHANSSNYDTFFTSGSDGREGVYATRRLRTGSTVNEDQPTSRATSGSFDMSDSYELDDLFSSFDKNEGGRMRSESLMALEEAAGGASPDAAAASKGAAAASSSSSFTGLTVSQAAQLTVSQAAAISGTGESNSKTLMPPPPLPKYGPGGLRLKARNWRGIGGLNLSSANRIPTSKKILTASYLASDEEALSLIPGRCTPEERKLKIERYLQKRSRRVWEKTIKYNVRKQFAESRPRVGGRFIPKPATQAALYASQLALLGKLEQKLDRRVLFAVKRAHSEDGGQYPPAVDSDSDNSSDDELSGDRKPPLVDFTQETLIMPKRVRHMNNHDGHNGSSYSSSSSSAIAHRVY